MTFTHNLVMAKGHQALMKVSIGNTIARMVRTFTRQDRNHPLPTNNINPTSSRAGNRVTILLAGPLSILRIESAMRSSRGASRCQIITRNGAINRLLKMLRQTFNRGSTKNGFACSSTLAQNISLTLTNSSRIDTRLRRIRREERNEKLNMESTTQIQSQASTRRIELTCGCVRGAPSRHLSRATACLRSIETIMPGSSMASQIS